MENLGLIGGFEYSNHKIKKENICYQDFDSIFDTKLHFNTFKNKSLLLDNIQKNKTRKSNNSISVSRKTRKK